MRRFLQNSLVEIVALAAILGGAFAASSCASIDEHVKVEGWPTLEIVEHHVPHAQMRDRCAKYMPFGSSPEACAEFAFAAKRCDLWFSADFPPAPYVVKHERLHCEGNDHVGADDMARMLRAWERH